MSYLKKELYDLIRSDSGLFDFIQEASFDGLWYRDLEKPENEWISPRFWVTLGYNPDEMPQTVAAWEQLCHPGDLKVAIENFNKHYYNSNHAYVPVLRFTHKNGSTVWLRRRGIAMRNNDGKAIRMLGTHIDITKEKESEENRKMLFNNIDQGFCIIEMIFDDRQKPIDYRFLEINEAFEKQTGMHNAAGKRMREFAPNHEEHWFEIYGKIALTGESIRFENRAEQLHRWYDVYAFRYGKPENRQVAILFNDITERKVAESQLLALNKDLEAFSYSVAHDLRAPLRAVRGYAEMLTEDYENRLDNEGKRVVKNIQQAHTKMGQLIDDLLAFSHLGKKEEQLNKIQTSGLPEVMGDYNLLYQVMFNLISNAIKYSAKKENPIVQIASEVNNDEVVFSVKDNGDR